MKARKAAVVPSVHSLGARKFAPLTLRRQTQVFDEIGGAMDGHRHGEEGDDRLIAQIGQFSV